MDHRADIYSLGVTFYEMLTGELPLGHFPPPSQTAGIDARLDHVVLRTLEREPADRYQHASDIKTEVESIVREPVAVPTPEKYSVGGHGTPTPPGYALWVGIPTLVLAGLYVLLVCGIHFFISLQAGPDDVPPVRLLGILLCVGIVLLGTLFGALNLVWLVRRQQVLSDSGHRPANRTWPPVTRKVLWTAVCLTLYLIFWTPGYGILDCWFWPYRGMAESTVALEPNLVGRPVKDEKGIGVALILPYQRLAVTEKITVRRLGLARCPRDWRGDGPRSERTQHKFIVELHRNGGTSDRIYIDGLDNFRWHYKPAHPGLSPPYQMFGVALDTATALAWMHMMTKPKHNVNDAPPEELRMQAGFWAMLVNEATLRDTPAPPIKDRPGAGRLVRQVCEIRSLLANNHQPMPFRDQDWIETENSSFEPEIAIGWVGIPVMLALWCGGLWWLRRPRGPSD